MKHLVGSILLIFLTYVLILLKDAGVFLTITNTDQVCTKIEGIIGGEDFDLINNQILISSGRHLPRFQNGGRGDLLLIKENGDIINLTSSFTKEFNPHGIDVIEVNNAVYIFAINHMKEKDVVEKFKLVNLSLEHVKTFVDEKFVALNDILALNETSFYITHDHGSKNHILQQVEHYTRMGRGGVGYFDEESGYKKVVSNLLFANGLEFFFDKNKVAVASMLNKEIEIFDIQKNYELKNVKTISVSPLAPDNILLGEKSLLVAGHPKLFDIKEHSLDRSKTSSSIVMNINQSMETSILYSNTGELFSGSSVAIEKSNKLLIGNIYEEFIVSCEL